MPGSLASLGPRHDERNSRMSYDRYSGTWPTPRTVLRCGIAPALLIAIGLGNADAAPKLRAPARLSCEVYNRLDRHFHCPGIENYLLRYGRKYCDRSLAETAWSPAGARWRD